MEAQLCEDQRSLYFNNVLFRGHLRPLSITAGGACSQTPQRCSNSYNVTCLLFSYIKTAVLSVIHTAVNPCS